MPFAYFDRLTRRQQGIYLRSDKITGVPLPGAGAMRPLVAELGAALESGDRDLTESASQLLASEMARALRLPVVRVTVLAARPHARWGELHGLYETPRRQGAPPTITLSKRPDEKNWSAKEIVCHLRDTEEAFMVRFQSMMVMDEPTFLPVEPDRVAIDRQYQRNDAQEALSTFKQRRTESLAFLRGLKPP